jgi:hypothetical protein
MALPQTPHFGPSANRAKGSRFVWPQLAQVSFTV